MSVVYSIDEMEHRDKLEACTFILADGKDSRSLAIINHLSKVDNRISDIILIKYEEFDDSFIKSLMPNARLTIIDVIENNPMFISDLRKCEAILNEDTLVDMTSIRVPELFALSKYLKMCNFDKKLEIAYATPLDYEFSKEPFISYHSYYGNLKICDLIGYGGVSQNMSYNQMVIFMGFEGMLSAKVNEDLSYEKLILVNSMPSFFDKYKDISLINNYEILSTRHEKLMYVPANNPFETYNFLCKTIDEKKPSCIAPLGSKPVSLGVCLYALAHEMTRVVYPASDEYNYHRSNSVHNMYVYKVFLKDI
ncbi:MAG: hypothetical protein IJ410_07745 [Oscillospiraceae bacterium]|nr:hypothetical protein [Oscillospiraceae bacterium]